MARPGSADSCGSNSLATPMVGNGVEGTDRLQLLSQGIPQFVRINGRSMLEKIMQSLGRSRPVFSVEDSGIGGIKVSIKLDVSTLLTENAQQIDHSVVTSEASMDESAAEICAVSKAFKLLGERHHVCIEDFSSRVVNKLESYSTFELFSEAKGALDSLLVQWDLSMQTFQQFAVKVHGTTFADHVRGPLTPRGKVLELLGEYLTSVHHSLHDKRMDIREAMHDVELDRRHYERRLAKKTELFTRNIPYHRVALSTKFLLEKVLCYYGLQAPKYTSFPEPSGMVKSTVEFTFPYMENFKLGGCIGIEGQGMTSVEADEEAAYQALLVIENDFITKVGDFNHYQRKKEVKIQKTLVAMLSKTLESADSLKMMFGEMINAVEWKISQFSVDPASFFEGPMGPGQIEAFSFCAKGLKGLANNVAQCYASSVAQFDVIQKISWKLVVMQSNDVLA